MAAKQKGTVKWFNSTKGYGFITPEIPEGSEDTPEDLFVHQSSINAEGFRSLGEGEAVEFNVETGEDGRTKAVDVTGPDGAYVQGAPRRQPRRNVAADGSVPQGNSRARGRGRNNRGPAGERKPPPGTPGESSGLQVVVHNLPWSCTAEALSEAFSSCGEIECADIIQDNSGRSRGFGTVRFKSTDSVQTAIDTMSNTEIEARPITVKMDRFA